MAREAVKIEFTDSDGDGDPRRYTIASSATITKGGFLVLSDPRTAAAQAADGALIAGFASMDKIADYSTTISAWTDGIFKVTASGAIPVGALLSAASPGNYVKQVTAAELTVASLAKVIGYALETAAADETFAMRLNL